jgi:anion-transporting  ArsA/GET3 family ATPase
MMLDLKTAWDELVRKDSRTPAQAEAILSNRLYQTVSTVLAGSLEYMAMEQVQRLSAGRRYDVIVLDTPPTSNALDFLGASDRLLDLLDNDAMRFVLGPMLKAGKFGLKLFALPSSLILKTLARFTGADFLRDVADFFVAFDGMYDGFKARAANVKALLSSPEAAFVLCTSPSQLTIDEALFFHRALADAKIQTAAVLVNRMQQDPRAQGGADAVPGIIEALGRAQIQDLALAPGGELLSSRLALTLHEQAALADIDLGEVRRLAHQLPEVPLYLAPRLRRDIHDLVGLWQIHESLGSL